MHEIAFQADKRSAECSPLFLFHEGILFVITFTRRIYSTSSHVFSPDSSVVRLRSEGGVSNSAVAFTLPACPLWIIVFSD